MSKRFLGKVVAGSAAMAGAFLLVAAPSVAAATAPPDSRHDKGCIFTSPKWAKPGHHVKLIAKCYEPQKHPWVWSEVTGKVYLKPWHPHQRPPLGANGDASGSDGQSWDGKKDYGHKDQGEKDYGSKDYGSKDGVDGGWWDGKKDHGVKDAPQWDDGGMKDAWKDGIDPQYFDHEKVLDGDESRMKDLVDSLGSQDAESDGSGYGQEKDYGKKGHAPKDGVDGGWWDGKKDHGTKDGIAAEDANGDAPKDGIEDRTRDAKKDDGLKDDMANEDANGDAPKDGVGGGWWDGKKDHGTKDGIAAEDAKQDNGVKDGIAYDRKKDKKFVYWAVVRIPKHTEPGHYWLKGSCGYGKLIVAPNGWVDGGDGGTGTNTGLAAGGATALAAAAVGGVALMRRRRSHGTVA